MINGVLHENGIQRGVVDCTKSRRRCPQSAKAPLCCSNVRPASPHLGYRHCLSGEPLGSQILQQSPHHYLQPTKNTHVDVAYPPQVSECLQVSVTPRSQRTNLPTREEERDKQQYSMDANKLGRYKAANKNEPELKEKVEDLTNFISACKFGMMTTRIGSSGLLTSRCMALAAKVRPYSNPTQTSKHGFTPSTLI